MRTTEQIDADIVQSERSMGFYVDFASQYETSVNTMLSELSRVREEKQKIERLRAERKVVDQERGRKSDIAFGYGFTVFGLGIIALGLSAIVWSTARDSLIGGLMFIALGIAASSVGFAAGFAAAQRAHARKPSTT